MPNDIPMFEKSGISIAMGQASDEVKSAATYVTSSSEEEGFAKAVRWLDGSPARTAVLANAAPRYYDV